MPWADLSNVTGALTRLIELNIVNVLSPGLVVTVVGTPPDQIGTNVRNTISLYLHHVKEAAATQNLPGPGSDLPNIATAPMGLELFYVLTAHQRLNAVFDAVVEQRLMGFALKTLHDFPTVTDSTLIAGNQIITGTQRGRKNCLHIQLRKLEPEQSLSIWTTGDRQFARLAGHYQVSLVLLDPDPPKRFPGVVLSLGAFITPMGGVSLSTTRNELQFTLPPSAGGGTQAIRVEPGRPALTAPVGPRSEFTILGENISAGLRRTIVLRNPRWSRLTPPADRVPVDPALNAGFGWSMEFLADRVNVRVGSQVTYLLPDGTPRTIDVCPGSYTLFLDTVVDDRIVGGQPRAITATSNEVAVSLCPRITAHLVVPPSNRIVLNLSPAFVANFGPADPLEIQVIVDGEVYTRRAAGAPVAGEYTVQAASITLRATFNVTLPGEHTVRLSVEGADAQPYWVPTP